MSALGLPCARKALLSLPDCSILPTMSVSGGEEVSAMELGWTATVFGNTEIPELPGEKGVNGRPPPCSNPFVMDVLICSASPTTILWLEIPPALRLVNPAGAE